MISRFAPLAFVFVAACGDSLPAPLSLPSSVASVTSSSAPAHDTPAPSSAPTSRALAPLDSVLPSAVGGIRVDGRRLREAPIYQAILRGARLAGVAEPIDAWTRACGFAPIEAIDELVLSGGKHPVIAARIHVEPARALACVRALVDGVDATYGGEPAVRFSGSSLAIVVGDVLLIAEETDLPSVLAPRDAGAPAGEVAKVLARQGDKIAVGYWRVGEGGVERVGGGMAAGPDGFAIQARADFDSEATVRRLDAPDVVTRFLTPPGVDAARDGALSDVLDSVHVRQEGRSVFFEAAVQGDSGAQVRYVGTLAVLAIAGTRRYLAHAKGAREERRGPRHQ